MNKKPIRFISKQDIINNVFIQTFSGIADAINKSNRLTGACFILCSMGTLAVVAEMRAEKKEIERKINNIEDRIEDLEKGV